MRTMETIRDEAEAAENVYYLCYISLNISFLCPYADVYMCTFPPISFRSKRHSRTLIRLPNCFQLCDKIVCRINHCSQSKLCLWRHIKRWSTLNLQYIFIFICITIYDLRFTFVVTPSYISKYQYGWAKQTLTKPVAGREGSDLTKFAAELVKNGVYWDCELHLTKIVKRIVTSWT